MSSHTARRGKCISLEILNGKREDLVCGDVFSRHSSRGYDGISRGVTEDKGNRVSFGNDLEENIPCDDRVAVGRSFLCKLIKHICANILKNNASVCSRSQALNRGESTVFISPIMDKVSLKSSKYRGFCENR